MDDSIEYNIKKYNIKKISAEINALKRKIAWIEELKVRFALLNKSLRRRKKLRG